MKNLEADWLSQWALIWRRDDRYHTPLDHVYFDLRDGGVHWVMGNEGAPFPMPRFGSLRPNS